jgi:hypothetical protein
MALVLLILLAAVGLLVAVLLALDLAGTGVRTRPGIRRSAAHRPGWRLTGTGVLLAVSMAWFSLFQSYRNWPYDHRHALERDLLPLLLAGIVLIIAGRSRSARSRHADADAGPPAAR